jgi:hypothetical protein
MLRRIIVFLATGMVVFLFVCSASAEVPHMVNYQGKLTTASGGCVNDTVQMTFSIYPDTLGSPADWTETQNDVIIREGVFNVLLGSAISIPSSVLDGSIKYLGVQVESDPEMTPLKPMISVAYAYRSNEADTADYARVFSGTADNADKVDGLHASSTPTAGYLYPLDGSAKIPNDRLYTGSGNGLDADLLDGQHASSFLSTGNDYGRSGVATDLYEGTSTLTDKYVNVTGPDSVVAASGTAFLGKASGGTSSTMYGIEGYGENTSSGNVLAGYFHTSSSGTGHHYGILGQGLGSSSSSAYGVRGIASNSSNGGSLGGYFTAETAGTGTHYGVYAEALSSSDGDAYGGYFYGNTSEGTGTAYGVKATSYSSSGGWHYGVYGLAQNTSSGYPRGGYFYASSSGTGHPVGVWGEGYTSTSGLSYGIIGEASNSSGRAVAASFYTPPPHTGPGGCTGVEISVPDSTESSTYGIYCLASNRSDGPVYGGYFDVSGGLTGTGTRYGVYGRVAAASGWAGYFEGDVRITDSLVVLGAKSAAVKVDNGEYRLLYSQESPEVWFEDFGEGRLVNGRAVVQIDPLFAQTANTAVKYHVFLTPQDEPLTLAVANRTTTSFEVIGPLGANIPFSYRIVAKRRGYEDIRLAKMGGPTPEGIALQQAQDRAEAEQERANLEEQRLEMKRQREQMEVENAIMQQERQGK